MKWFKHDANTTMDSKIKKLIIRYGAVGYAIYFHCLELITDCVDESNITFELEHDSEIIADNLRITGDANKSGKEIVEEIMKYMIELKLFEENENGQIFCFKLLKRLDMSMTSNPRLRNLISMAKDNYDENHDSVMINHDSVMINHDSVMLEKKRKEKNRIDYINSSSEVFPQEAKDMTKYLFDECKKDNPHFDKSESELKKWTEDFSKCNRIDGYSYSELKRVLFWAKNDSFWRNNIMSAAKFRKQLPSLYAKACVKNNNYQSKLDDAVKKNLDAKKEYWLEES